MLAPGTLAEHVEVDAGDGEADVQLLQGQRGLGLDAARASGPGLASSPDSAMEKQAAWAGGDQLLRVGAGLVLEPLGEVVRTVFSTPVSVDTVPCPSLRPPFQTALAFEPWRLSL